MHIKMLHLHTSTSHLIYISLNSIRYFLLTKHVWILSAVRRSEALYTDGAARCA